MARKQKKRGIYAAFIKTVKLQMVVVEIQALTI
jgi:hypothetical protein